MRTQFLVGIASLAALTGCGLETLFSNVGRTADERPASTVRGPLGLAGVTSATFVALDGNGAEVLPFQASAGGGSYELRLPSSRYSMLRPQVRVGNVSLRAIVPLIGEESAAAGVGLDARSITETLIVEAALSAQGLSFALVTPTAYVGDGVTTGARTQIRADLDLGGPTGKLLGMVERMLQHVDLLSAGTNPDLFGVPELSAAFVVTVSPVSASWLARSRFDYDGDNLQDLDTAKFDAQLAAAAQLYQPSGCADPDNIRLVLSVDFNEGSLDGTCQAVNRFAWVKDKPDKQMFFVGWIHEESQVQDPAIAALLGNGVPNQLAMFDDGTNGDEVAQDGIWTIVFDLPIDPARVLRIGYKYTWGTRGAVWTGSEEWPGNSRILEVVDAGPPGVPPVTQPGDGFVYRRDVFADEKTNKDRANLHPSSGGAIEWDTALHGCGPEAREQKFTLHEACRCGTEWFTPRAIGPLKVACTL
ncbi:MAG: hypothetical protein IPQ24_07010 [Anaeromyxobacter sp.]|nr:hypothetical protein [Anaeromyxobacter sp.]